MLLFFLYIYIYIIHNYIDIERCKKERERKNLPITPNHLRPWPRGWPSCLISLASTGGNNARRGGTPLILGRLDPGVGLAVSLASVVLIAIMPKEVGLCQGNGDADDDPGVGLAVSLLW